MGAAHGSRRGRDPHKAAKPTGCEPFSAGAEQTTPRASTSQTTNDEARVRRDLHALVGGDHRLGHDRATVPPDLAMRMRCGFAPPAPPNDPTTFPTVGTRIGHTRHAASSFASCS
jgi:hypothetical protein